jgi:hypothetical protein
MKLGFDFLVRFSKKKNTPITNYISIRLVGAEFVSCGETGRRMDGHHEANSRFPQFRERAQKCSRLYTLSPTCTHTVHKDYCTLASFHLWTAATDAA